MKEGMDRGILTLWHDECIRRRSRRESIIGIESEREGERERWNGGMSAYLSPSSSHTEEREIPIM